MYQHIDKLRRAPDHVKTRTALLGAGAVTALIFVAWLSVILPSNTSVIVAQDQQTTASGDEGNTPLDSLKRSTAQVIDATKNLFTSTVSQINLQQDYTKMKTQVETGQVELAPQPTPNQ